MAIIIERAFGRSRGRCVPAPAQQPAVQVDKRKQAHAQGEAEDGGQQEERLGISFPQSAESVFDRLAGVGENVPEQEYEHAGGDRVQESLDRWAQSAQPSHGQPDEDRETRHRAQQGRRGLAHDFLVSACKGND